MPLGRCDIAAVALLGEVDGSSAEVVAEAVVESRALAVEVHVPLPGESGRYRWQVISHDGAVQRTAWSAWLHPTPAMNLTLAVWEG